MVVGVVPMVVVELVPDMAEPLALLPMKFLWPLAGITSSVVCRTMMFTLRFTCPVYIMSLLRLCENVLCKGNPALSSLRGRWILVSVPLYL